MFLFSKISSLKTSRPLFCKVPRLESFHKTQTLPKSKNMKFMLKNLTDMIIKKIIT